MKKSFIILFIIMLFTSAGYAQGIVNPKKASSKTDSKVSVSGNSNYWHNYHRNRGYRYWDKDVSLAKMKTKIKMMKEEVEESEKYSKRKKAALIKELDFALKKILESDQNGDGILNDHEQKAYKKRLYID